MLADIGHDPLKIVGRKSAGTLTIRKDTRGLHATIALPETTFAADALENIRLGNTRGWSFMFEPLKESWIIDQEMPLRTLTDGVIYSVSMAVGMPAYPDTEHSGPSVPG